MDKEVIRLALLTIFLLAISCNKEKSPEDALREYVTYRFSPNQSKDVILEKVDGLLKDQMQSMSEEELKKFLDTSSFKKNAIKINLTKCQEKQCHITYTVSYDQLKEDKTSFVVETKKIALLDKSSGEWKIIDVNNVKTFLDSKENIAP